MKEFADLIVKGFDVKVVDLDAEFNEFVLARAEEGTAVPIEIAEQKLTVVSLDSVDLIYLEGKIIRLEAMASF